MSEEIHVALVGTELAVAFGDGSEVYLSLELLRRACPCAACQGEPDAMGRVIRPEVSIGRNGYELRRMDRVGGYALQLFWGDSHSTGIYSFDYLKQLSAAQLS